MSDAHPQPTPPVMPPASTPAGPTPTSEPFWAKPSIGIFSLVLFALALGVVWWAKQEAAFNLLIGAVISNTTTVIGYYFGSSSGSAQKTAMIAGTRPGG